MGVTVADISVILKEDYQPTISDLLNHKNILMHRLQRNTEDFEGKRAYMPVLKGRNEAIGARAEGGTLPSPTGSQQYDVAYFDTKNNYGRIKLTGQAMAKSAGMESFLTAIDSEVNGMVRDLSNDMNRQFFGDGTGVITTAATTPALATTINCASTRFLRPNQYIDILTAASGADPGNCTNRKITSITSTTAFVVDAPISGALTTNESIYRHGSRANEIGGLAAMISDSNPSTVAWPNGYGEINRTTVTAWKAQVLSNSGTNRPLSLDLIDAALDQIDIQSDGECSLMITDHLQKRRYAGLVVPDRRFPTANGAPIDLDGGFKALTHDGIPIVADKDAPTGKIWGLDESTIRLFVLKDFEWMDWDGSVLNRVPNEDAYEATLCHYGQLGCSDPGNNFLLSDLTNA